MKRIILSALLTFLSFSCLSQTFKSGDALMGKPDGKGYKSNWDYWFGLPSCAVTLNDKGEVLKVTDAIFESVGGYGSECLSLCPVELPVKVFNKRKKDAEYNNKTIWLCLDKELNIKFVFPLETEHVYIDTTMRCFLYSDFTGLTRHMITKGVIDTLGQVILKVGWYSIIKRQKDSVIGLKQTLKRMDKPQLVEMIAKPFSTDDTQVSVFLRWLKKEPREKTQQESAYFEAFNSLYSETASLSYAYDAFVSAAGGNDPELAEASKQNAIAIKTIMDYVDGVKVK